MKKIIIGLFSAVLFTSAHSQTYTPDEYALKSIQDEICASKKRTEELEARLKSSLQKKQTVEFEADFAAHSAEAAKIQKDLDDKITQLKYDAAVKIAKLQLVLKAKWEFARPFEPPASCK